MKNMIWILVFLVLGSMPFVFVGVLLENKIAIVGIGVFCVVAFYVMLAGMIQEEIQHDKNHPKDACPPVKEIKHKKERPTKGVSC